MCCTRTTFTSWSCCWQQPGVYSRTAGVNTDFWGSTTSANSFNNIWNLNIMCFRISSNHIYTWAQKSIEKAYITTIFYILLSFHKLYLWIYKVYISTNRLYLTSKKLIAASEDVCRVCCCQVFLHNVTQTRRHLEDIRANFLSQHYTQVLDETFMRYLSLWR